MTTAAIKERLKNVKNIPLSAGGRVGRRGIGVELSHTHVETAMQRIYDETAQLTLDEAA